MQEIKWNEDGIADRDDIADIDDISQMESFGNTEDIEAYISRFPIYQYSFQKPEMLEYSENIRQVCKRTCPHYSGSWSCIPAVGKLEKCRDHCLRYTDVLIFSTVTELADPSEQKQKTSAQREHERLTRLINDHMRDQGYLTYVISSSYCKKCPKCTFPRDYCRFPEEMFPCIESHGIMIADLCSQCDMDYYMGDRLFLLFTLLFYKDTGFALQKETSHEERNFT